MAVGPGRIPIERELNLDAFIVGNFIRIDAS